MEGPFLAPVHSSLSHWVGGGQEPQEKGFLATEATQPKPRQFAGQDTVFLEPTPHSPAQALLTKQQPLEGVPTRFRVILSNTQEKGLHAPGGQTVARGLNSVPPAKRACPAEAATRETRPLDCCRSP